MMEGIAITHTGLEKLAGKEVSSIIKRDAKTSRAALVFPIDSPIELCSLAYNARLLSAVFLKIASFKLKDSDDIKKNLSSDMFGEWIDKDVSFAVRCKRVGDHAFSSQEIEYELGELIHEGMGAKVNLSGPDVQVIVYVIDKDCYVGIDFAGVDLSKRSYRIFSFGDPLKGTVVQAMNLMAGIKLSDKILDPFSSSGLFSIEAALYLTGKSPHFYDKEAFSFNRLPILSETDFDDFFSKEDRKMKELKLEIHCSDHLQKNVRSAEKNAKIAGVNKLINFSRMDIEWLDTKFEEGSVDKIVTHPPQISKRTKPDQVARLMDEFFYVAKVILAQDGKIVMVFNRPDVLESALKKHGFILSERHNVMQGGESLFILVFSKALEKDL